MCLLVPVEARSQSQTSLLHAVYLVFETGSLTGHKLESELG